MAVAESISASVIWDLRSRSPTLGISLGVAYCSRSAAGRMPRRVARPISSSSVSTT